MANLETLSRINSPPTLSLHISLASALAATLFLRPTPEQLACALRHRGRETTTHTLISPFHLVLAVQIPHPP